MKPKVLFQMTGSIACFKACQAVSDLLKAGCEVQVVATPSALKFVGASTLEGLTGRPVLTDLYQSGHAMDHIRLARESDVLVICPATAHTLNRLAAGLADDLIGTLFLAVERAKPYLIFPAMNVEMFHHPITQKSIRTLHDLGATVLETGSGALACGETGDGRLLEPSQIVEAVMSALTRANTKGHVLITMGGTREPIDDVRFISNQSSGKTGAHLADAFANAGWDTTVLAAKDSVHPSLVAAIQSFTTTQDLEQLLQQTLSHHSFDAVIHLAAVSDYSVKKYEGKLGSAKESLHLELHRNPKLIDAIKTHSKNPKVRLVAFKLTAQVSDSVVQTKVQSLFEHSHADLVVQNDLHSLPDRTLFFRDGGAQHVRSLPELSKAIIDFCTQESSL